jgi:hypothetical protein
MEDMQDRMNAILSNPEMMQQIMTMAQSLGQAQPQKQDNEPEKQDASGFSLPDIDLSIVKKLSGFAGQSNIDGNQQTLLKALIPYLSRERISKLEKAMRAAKMANMASAFLGKSGFQFNSGR